jgi:hypothetical protein
MLVFYLDYSFLQSIPSTDARVVVIDYLSIGLDRGPGADKVRTSRRWRVRRGQSPPPPLRSATTGAVVINVPPTPSTAPSSVPIVTPTPTTVAPKTANNKKKNKTPPSAVASLVVTTATPALILPPITSTNTSTSTVSTPPSSSAIQATAVNVSPTVHIATAVHTTSTAPTVGVDAVDAVPVSSSPSSQPAVATASAEFLARSASRSPQRKRERRTLPSFSSSSSTTGSTALSLMLKNHSHQSWDTMMMAPLRVLPTYSETRVIRQALSLMMPWIGSHFLTSWHNSDPRYAWVGPVLQQEIPRVCPACISPNQRCANCISTIWSSPPSLTDDSAYPLGITDAPSPNGEYPSPMVTSAQEALNQSQYQLETRYLRFAPMFASSFLLGKSARACDFY